MSRRSVVIWISGAIGAVVFCYFFPLFRVKQIDISGDARQSPGNAVASVSVTDYAETFWNERLPGAFDGAVDIEELFEAIERDADQARSKFGRQVGLGGACFLFVRGVGRVEEMGSDDCTLKIGDWSCRVRIRTGVVVGNAVRDCTGLIDVNDFANSQDFNNLSADLNQRVEAYVIAPSREQLRIGARVSFVGCARVSNDRDLAPLGLVPVCLDITDPEVRP